MKELATIKQKVDSALERFMDEKVNNSTGFVKECMLKNKEFLLRGGKRLRPILCIKSYESICGAIDEYIVKKSIALEMLHVSTLIHDDIMDNDDLRRGKPSMHKMIGIPNAIIQGNILLSLAYSSLADEEMQLLNNTYLKVNYGQMLDMHYEEQKISEQEYLEMARLKTGELLGTAAELGVLIAKGTIENRQKLRQYAQNIAIGFQLHDDLMDLSKDMKKGNTLGSDIMHGKRTLMVVKALEKGLELPALGKMDATEAEIDESVKILLDNGIIKYCSDKAEEYINSAKKIVSDEFFLELADYMIKRKN
ncbi:MAG: polyprenyl synthetase family protein [Nanoarchaeota archaeon]|nr:polyprenyl synthetase family protein [Nanoarchaeota archaeon]MBU1704121.1 polyprenyl synthetase family protein [Nanoarchaeota archaeon]